MHTYTEILLSDYIPSFPLGVPKCDSSETRISITTSSRAEAEKLKITWKSWLSIQTFGLDESLRFFAFSIFRVAFSLFRVVFSIFRVAFSSCWFRFFGFAAVELHQCYQVKLIVYWSRKSEKTKRKTEKVCRGACTLHLPIVLSYRRMGDENILVSCPVYYKDTSRLPK